MKIQIIVLCALVFSAVSYTEENGVLILTDDDFPTITEEFPFLMIEFYAPWCGHCKKLAPIYDEIATELAQQASPVRVAKIDCDAFSKAKALYEVQGFPTLIFFAKGQKIPYNGQRTKEFMINWMLKKTRDPVVEITSEKLESLQKEAKVSVVFYGDLSSVEGEIIQKLAVVDDYNTYFYIRESSKATGSAEIFRPFADSVTYERVDEKIKDWISSNERPPVVDFDDRTIGDIFSNKKSGVLLFDAAGEEALVNAFSNAANEWRQNHGTDLLFSHIPKSNEHLNGLASYIKTSPSKVPVVFLDGSTRTKSVLISNPATISSQDIVHFLEEISNKSAKTYKIDEEIQYPESNDEEL